MPHGLGLDLDRDGLRQALTHTGPTLKRPVQDPLAVLLLDNQLYFM